MAQVTFNLLALKPSSEDTLLSSLRALPKAQRPLWLGHIHHWLHEPTLSTDALLGLGPTPKTWNYLLVCPASNDLSSVSNLIADKWSITAPVDATWLDNFAEQHPARLTSSPTPLPKGWSPEDPSALRAAVPPPDLHASLGLESRPFGKEKPTVLKDFIDSFGATHTGPVAMLNLLAYTPNGGREQYFKYVQAFSESTGVKYGGAPLFLGRDAEGWTSQQDEGNAKHWVDCALVWYPSLWHFGCMLDNEGYAKVDREFKQGAIRDNPLLCCSEIQIGYAD